MISMWNFSLISVSAIKGGTCISTNEPAQHCLLIPLVTLEGDGESRRSCGSTICSSPGSSRQTWDDTLSTFCSTMQQREELRPGGAARRRKLIHSHFLKLVTRGEFHLLARDKEVLVRFRVQVIKRIKEIFHCCFPLFLTLFHPFTFNSLIDVEVWMD